MSVNPRHERTASRDDVIITFVVQGIAGFLVLVWVTISRLDQTRSILAALGDEALLLIAIFGLYTAALALLRFAVTDLTFVSLVTTAFVSAFPILGGVVSIWIAVGSVILTRLLGMFRLGPTKVDMDDPRLQIVRTFGHFGTYGIPLTLAVLVYEWTGGSIPIGAPSAMATVRVFGAACVMILTNNLLMARVEVAYGYSNWKIWRIALVDSSIVLMTLPYAICMAFSWRAAGWPTVVAFAFSGVLANATARNLAETRVASQRQLKRLASLTNIGKAISIRGSTDELLTAIHNECSRVIEVEYFSIALLDEVNGELSFELDVRGDKAGPKVRISCTEGLNAWVVSNNQPLMIGSNHEEKTLDVSSVDDGVDTESWLGVPMVARDRVIGIISVQSHRRNAFTHDDRILLMAIANQAAVAIDNANLYRDLEGLTYALEHRVLERTNELREANLRLLAADRSKNQFLANMSHELRTPLNSIIGFSQLLLQNLEELVPARLFGFLGNIRTSGTHLLQLINDILDLSKIDAGKMQLTTQWFALDEVVGSVRSAMSRMASDRSVSIVAEIAELPTLNLDEGRTKQVLFNLVSNAVKFSAEGGVVRICAFRIGPEDSGLGVDSVRIDVIDEGVGIAEDELEKIFDEFYQTDEGRRGRGGGTGLGLALARSFVDLHHGMISAISTPGEGSTFTVVLPVDANALSSRVVPLKSVPEPSTEKTGESIA